MATLDSFGVAALTDYNLSVTQVCDYGDEIQNQMVSTWRPGSFFIVFVGAHVSCKYKCGASTIQFYDTVYRGFECRCRETGKGICILEVLFYEAAPMFLYFKVLFASFMLLQGIRSKRLWGKVKSLEVLQPYANPRSKYPGKDLYIKKVLDLQHVFVSYLLL